MGTVMGLLAPPEPLTGTEIKDKLTYWSEHLIEHKRGDSNVSLTLGEIRGQLDKYLDLFIEWQGR